ncbi:MAG: GyrI-like domain-containing protein [Eubacteriales bacterium]
MSAPEIITCQIHRKAFYVLGIENKKSELIHDPRCPACWDEFFQTKANETICKYQAESGLLGIFCTSEPGYWNYLIGGIVKDIQEAPKGMYLREFPEQDYAVITHEPVDTSDESNAQIGRLVGYAHNPSGWSCPEGFKRDNGPVMFIESYPPPDENGKHRFEIWIPLTKA